MTGYRDILVNSPLVPSLILVVTTVLTSTAWAQELDRLTLLRCLEPSDVLPFDDPPDEPGFIAWPPGGDTVVDLDPPPSADGPAGEPEVLFLREGPSGSEIVDAVRVPSLAAVGRDEQGRTMIMSPPGAAPADSNRLSMTSDDRGNTFVLEEGPAGPAVTVIDPNRESQPLPGAPVRRLDLRGVVGQDGRASCIAFNPQNQHLYLLIRNPEEIVETTTDGGLIARRRFNDLDFTDLKGCMFAPSSDGTDASSVVNLFIVIDGEVCELNF